jgi:hypothetical protein
MPFGEPDYPTALLRAAFIRPISVGYRVHPDCAGCAAGGRRLAAGSGCRSRIGRSAGGGCGSREPTSRVEATARPLADRASVWRPDALPSAQPCPGASPSRQGIGNQEPVTSATLRRLLKLLPQWLTRCKAQICAAEAQKWRGGLGEGR